MEKKAKEPFRFVTRFHLSELTGLKAATLNQLLTLIKDVPESCIYHHTHRFLQQHLFLSPEPPNDFAYWISSVLGDEELGERLASIDTIEFPNIRSLREKIIATITEHTTQNPPSLLRFAKEGREFYFLKSLSFIFPTAYTADDIPSFIEAIKKTTINSIYFHIFEARLRLEKNSNDFSNWFATSLDEKEIADAIARLDPYTQTLETLRKRIIFIIERKTRDAKGVSNEE